MDLAEERKLAAQLINQINQALGDDEKVEAYKHLVHAWIVREDNTDKVKFETELRKIAGDNYSTFIKLHNKLFLTLATYTVVQ